MTFGSSVPQLNSKRGQFDATVAVNRTLCREHFELTLRLPSFSVTAPGQFVQVTCADWPDELSEVEWDENRPPRLSGTEIADRTAILRRPFSLAGRRDTAEGVEIDLIHRVVGVGTDWLSRLSVGDTVSVIGPLGNTFTLPQNGGTALLVGGGVGIPPMIYLASQLSGTPAVAFCGALTRDLLALSIEPKSEPPAVGGAMNITEFARHGVPAVISTDDGSYGYRGFVTQALEQYLDQFFPTGGPAPRPTIYTCGPEPMMKRIADIAASRQLPVQIAVERAMACGMGTCQSCVIKVKTDDAAAPWRYKLACTDGPVFAGSDLLW
ncbi:MAG TPA: dihydroorotate dehydrogenase electron transfer subunit [Tepidisphaeraceae bacterium]|jgi:dihydroorotate dehydrogenase electron transfer subunit|nr:dihydroorotate dehydrogenase electron transfer subunit [Tepidisphaeraceae bacterium]